MYILCILYFLLGGTYENGNNFLPIYYLKIRYDMVLTNENSLLSEAVCGRQYPMFINQDTSTHMLTEQSQ